MKDSADKGYSIVSSTICELRDRVVALEAAGCAEQGGTPELKPNQAPSSDRCLEEEVLDAMGEGTEAEACKAILAVAKWLRSRGGNTAAAALEQEANR